MKTLLTIVFAVVLSVAASTYYIKHNAQVSVPTDESAYARVMRTGVLRCGYALWPPYAIYKEPNTGEIKGMAPDLINAMATGLGLKVEWTEETGWGSFIEGLRSKRFDVMCAPLWQNAERGRYVGYTSPWAYSALHFYAHAGDTRFDASLDKLNSPDFKLAVMDGEMSQITARRFFPKARQVATPQLGDISQLMNDVATGKADGVFLEPSLAKEFAAKNPGTIRQVTTTPFQIFPDVFGVAIQEEGLRRMLDSALLELMNQGEVDRIISSYEPDRSIFIPVAKPYAYVAPAPLP